MKRIVAVSASTDHLAALDGLRGVAALLVVLFHIGWPNHLTNNNFVRNGYLAVDLFFILSGFIIFRNYNIRIKNFGDFWKFLCLRFFRVYPLHIAILAILVCMELVKFAVHGSFQTSSEQAPFTGSNSISALAANILLVQGLHVLDGQSWNIPSWTISCEFATYIIFGIAALAGVFRARLFLPCVCLAAGCVYLLLAFQRNGLDVTYDWGLGRCLAGFSFGALIVQASRRASCPLTEQSFQFASVIALIAIVSVMSLTNGPAVVLAIPLFIVAVALLRTDDGPAAKILMHASVQYLGRISYSVYMVQYLTIISLTVVLKRLFKIPISIDPQTQKVTMLIDPWIGDALVLGSVLAILLISGITYAWIESPGRSLGRRVAGRRSLGVVPLEAPL